MMVVVFAFDRFRLRPFRFSCAECAGLRRALAILSQRSACRLFRDFGGPSFPFSVSPNVGDGAPIGAPSMPRSFETRRASGRSPPLALHRSDFGSSGRASARWADPPPRGSPTPYGDPPPSPSVAALGQLRAWPADVGPGLPALHSACESADAGIPFRHLSTPIDDALDRTGRDQYGAGFKSGDKFIFCRWQTYARGDSTRLASIPGRCPLNRHCRAAASAA